MTNTDYNVARTRVHIPCNKFLIATGVTGIFEPAQRSDSRGMLRIDPHQRMDGVDKVILRRSQVVPQPGILPGTPGVTPLFVPDAHYIFNVVPGEPTLEAREAIRFQPGGQEPPSMDYSNEVFYGRIGDLWNDRMRGHITTPDGASIFMDYNDINEPGGADALSLRQSVQFQLRYLLDKQGFNALRVIAAPSIEPPTQGLSPDIPKTAQPGKVTRSLDVGAYITPEDMGPMVFVDYESNNTQIEPQGTRRLFAGRRVAFDDVHRDGRGLVANRVWVLK